MNVSIQKVSSFHFQRSYRNLILKNDCYNKMTNKITFSNKKLLLSKRYFSNNAIQVNDNNNNNNKDNQILALDFDGVICASSGESSYSSIIATNNK